MVHAFRYADFKLNFAQASAQDSLYFFDHFGQRPKTKARQMLRRLEQLVSHRASPTRNHAQSGRDCRTFGCRKADPKHIRFIKLDIA